MHDQGGQQTVVTAHDVKAFLQRFAVVLCGSPFLCVVGYHHFCITKCQSHAFGFAHDSDTPVDIG